MKNKGFTLIELLAVIVILAIIALIATPIIINIIGDAREESNQRSVELYANAVKNAIATYQMRESSTPTSLSDVQKYIKYDGNQVVCNMEKSKLYEDGTIYLDGCTVNGSDKVYTYGDKQENSVAKACSYQDLDGSGDINENDMVTCGSESFYVMNNDESNVTMISRYNLNVGDNPYPGGTLGIQNENATGSYFDPLETTLTYGYVAFSTENYWSSTTSEYPAFVYNSDSNLYQYVETYETYLKETIKVNTVSASLMNYEYLENYCVVYDQCDEFEDGEICYTVADCGSAPGWFYDSRFWLGSAEDSSSIWVSPNSESGFAYSSDFSELGFGIRPVVTISINEIEK